MTQRRQRPEKAAGGGSQHTLSLQITETGGMDMDQSRPGPDALQPASEVQPSVEARRRMLKRSLGAAAPVALTLASTPVSAGLCVNASSFVSVATFASRQPRGLGAASACSGRSPSEWWNAVDWPPGIIKATATFSAALEDGSNSNSPLLTDVLAENTSLEAAVAAVFLSASHGLLSAPFTNGNAVREIWANIKLYDGYAPAGGGPALTRNGTQQWLALTWQASQP